MKSTSAAFSIVTELSEVILRKACDSLACWRMYLQHNTLYLLTRGDYVLRCVVCSSSNELSNSSHVCTRFECGIATSVQTFHIEENGQCTPAGATVFRRGESQADSTAFWNMENCVPYHKIYINVLLVGDVVLIGRAGVVEMDAYRLSSRNTDTQNSIVYEFSLLAKEINGQGTSEDTDMMLREDDFHLKYGYEIILLPQVQTQGGWNYSAALGTVVEMSCFSVMERMPHWLKGNLLYTYNNKMSTFMVNEKLPLWMDGAILLIDDYVVADETLTLYVNELLLFL